VIWPVRWDAKTPFVIIKQSSWYEWDGQNLLLRVKIQPRASKDEWLGVCGEAAKIRLTAPPVEGKANQHLIKFLAKLFNTTKRDIKIVSGETARNKRIQIKAPKTLPKDIVI